MNQAFRSPDLSPTTQAAEGLPRRRWSVAEIEEATRLGLFDEDERFELIGGEIVPMNAKGFQHEVIKTALTLYFAEIRPREVVFAQETTFRLNEDTFVEPDFVFFRRSDGLANLNPRTALLAIEVADSSLSWDLGRKARIYADFGIPELWVIDAVSRTIHVHREPRLEGYRSIRAVAETERIESASVPGIVLTLSELETF
ncbi:MAG: Uma2 family endonuclease [Mesorhizobium sp.]|nr:Uma2 family endonuclease [Mesorhizobium sp.]MCO5161590.1 Uma2 family endonuclease [Mesorhizobium sp.]